MLFIPENHADISRYFRHTYVKFKETGDTLFLIKDVSPTCVTGVTSEDAPFELYMHNDHPYEVDYLLPHKSYFQYSENACMLTRIPAKQYQRGVSDANTKIYRVNREGGINGVPVNFSPLLAYVNKPKFFDLDSIPKLEKRFKSIVLSRRMCYAVASRTILLDTTVIANVDTKSKTVVCLSPLFIPELQQLCKNSTFKVAK